MAQEFYTGFDKNLFFFPNFCKRKKKKDELM